MDKVYERNVVCGMYLFETENCEVCEINSKKYYFCGKTCRDEFEKNKTRCLKMDKSEIVDQSNKDWEQTSRDPVCGQMINIISVVNPATKSLIICLLHMQTKEKDILIPIILMSCRKVIL